MKNKLLTLTLQSNKYFYATCSFEDGHNGKS
jgi:hypothetical protein